MRNRKYLIGALVAVIGTLAFSSIASARPIAHSLQAKATPAKQDKKKFGGASLNLIIASQYDSFASSQSPRQLVIGLDRNMKLVNGNVPACQQSQIANKPTAQAQAACPQSIVGTGTVSVNGGALSGVVTLFGGGPTTLWAQVDVANGAVVLTLNGAISGRTLTISGIPNTPGTILDSTNITLNKRKTGKKTFYLMARCKSKKWTVTESTSWYSGETMSASSTQKCKQKKAKK
jgi:hypothetical protein